MKIYKITPYDEIHDIWILKRKVWWIIYVNVAYGSKFTLSNWVKNNGGILE